ncbi:hypothetical protein HDU78_005865 [Chytriomyces hyalinus]|nr:hypothetical protein HDU78_005865 [Chytriomyces hyalinus]
MEVVDYIQAHFGIAVISEVDAEYQTAALLPLVKLPHKADRIVRLQNYDSVGLEALLLEVSGPASKKDLSKQADDFFKLSQEIVPLYKLQIPSVLQDVNKWLKSIEIAVKFHSIRKAAEHIDIMHSTSTLGNVTSLSSMLDALFQQCNSKDYVSMSTEWQIRWAKTESVFPVNQVEWSDLGERYFTIHCGHSLHLDKQLGSIFKKRLQEVILPGDREFGPLLLAIQADRYSKQINSAEVLKQVMECIAGKALLCPPTKEKLAG